MTEIYGGQKDALLKRANILFKKNLCEPPFHLLSKLTMKKFLPEEIEPGLLAGWDLNIMIKHTRPERPALIINNQTKLTFSRCGLSVYFKVSDMYTFADS